MPAVERLGPLVAVGVDDGDRVAARRTGQPARRGAVGAENGLVQIRSARDQLVAAFAVEIGRPDRGPAVVENRAEKFLAVNRIEAVPQPALGAGQQSDRTGRIPPEGIERGDPAVAPVGDAELLLPQFFAVQRKSFQETLCLIAGRRNRSGADEIAQLAVAAGQLRRRADRRRKPGPPELPAVGVDNRKSAVFEPDPDGVATGGDGGDAGGKCDHPPDFERGKLRPGDCPGTDRLPFGGQRRKRENRAGQRHRTVGGDRNFAPLEHQAAHPDAGHSAKRCEEDVARKFDVARGKRAQQRHPGARRSFGTPGAGAEPDHFRRFFARLDRLAEVDKNCLVAGLQLIQSAAVNDRGVRRAGQVRITGDIAVFLAMAAFKAIGQRPA